MRTLKVSVNTGWTTDKGEEIVMKAEGATLDEAVDNAKLYVIKEADTVTASNAPNGIRYVDRPEREVFWKDADEFHPDTIESMIYSAWFDAIEDELLDDEELDCGHMDRKDDCPVCRWDSEESK